MKRQRYDQNDANQRLYHQSGIHLRISIGILLGIILDEHVGHVFRQCCAIAKPFKFFKQYTGSQSTEQDGHGYRCHAQEKFPEFPSSSFRDQQILRLANQCANTTKRCTDSPVHNQTSQKGTELVEFFSMEFVDVLIFAGVVFIVKLFSGCDLVIYPIKSNCYRD